jgi:hypothetical protein
MQFHEHFFELRWFKAWTTAPLDLTTQKFFCQFILCIHTFGDKIHNQINGFLLLVIIREDYRIFLRGFNVKSMEYGQEIWGNSLEGDMRNLLNSYISYI